MTTANKYNYTFISFSRLPKVLLLRGGSRNFRKGGPIPSPPFPFSPLPSLLLLPLPSPPYRPSFFPPSSLPLFSPPLPFRSRAPLIQIEGLGERCKLPQRRAGRSPNRKRLWCTLKLRESRWWQSF